MDKVLDAYAIMAYLQNEPGSEKVKELFIKAADSGKNLLMTTVNWGEVYYILARERGKEQADQIQQIIRTFPIDFVPVDMELARQAALLKAVKKLSYADCFAAALAGMQKGELFTGDKEFQSVEKDVKIQWIV